MLRRTIWDSCGIHLVKFLRIGSFMANHNSLSVLADAEFIRLFFAHLNELFRPLGLRSLEDYRLGLVQHYWRLQRTQFARNRIPSFHFHNFEKSLGSFSALNRYEHTLRVVVSWVQNFVGVLLQTATAEASR